MRPLHNNAPALLVALVVVALVVLGLAHVAAPDVLESALLILVGGAAGVELPRGRRP